LALMTLSGACLVQARGDDCTGSFGRERRIVPSDEWPGASRGLEQFSTDRNHLIAGPFDAAGRKRCGTQLVPAEVGFGDAAFGSKT
jgi:hypothetical protein